MSHPGPDWQAPELRSSDGERFAVRHIWCVGRNYAEHAREMGADPERGEPIFFAKPAQSAVQSALIEYPPATADLQHEVELVVLLGQGGRRLAAAEWGERIWGFAVGVDLTRRDLQARCKQAGHPWELAKGFDQSAPLGLVASARDWRPQGDRPIALEVNGQQRQSGRLGDMIWSVEKLLQRLSQELTLNPGDLVFTGTPAGVGSLQPGDQVRASIEGLPDCRFSITASG